VLADRVARSEADVAHLDEAALLGFSQGGSFQPQIGMTKNISFDPEGD